MQKVIFRSCDLEKSVTKHRFQKCRIMLQFGWVWLHNFGLGLFCSFIWIFLVLWNVSHCIQCCRQQETARHSWEELIPPGLQALSAQSLAGSSYLRFLWNVSITRCPISLRCAVQLLIWSGPRGNQLANRLDDLQSVVIPAGRGNAKQCEHCVDWLLRQIRSSEKGTGKWLQ